MNFNEARAAFLADKARFEQLGVVFPNALAYIPDGWKQNSALAMDQMMAMDALPTPSTDPNSAVPMMLTTLIDPQVYKVLFTPNKAAEIYSEVKKGSWVDDTAMFPIVEHTGEVASYGDYNEVGRAGANTNWPQRQSYLFQTIKMYGERELERAGLAKINWVSELDSAAATILSKFLNLTYFFGVQGLQNYGALNDPNLAASITPATKAAGGVRWINAGVVVATANEIFNDIQSIFFQLVNQTNGLVDAESELILAMSPQSAVALTQTNTFNVNVEDLLKKNFPKLKVETAVQLGATSASNPQGIAAGNLVQMIAPEIEGMRTVYCAFNEKMRAHKLIPQTSAFHQKVTGGSWGAIIRLAYAIASMVGV